LLLTTRCLCLFFTHNISPTCAAIDPSDLKLVTELKQHRVFRYESKSKGFTVIKKVVASGVNAVSDANKIKFEDEVCILLKMNNHHVVKVIEVVQTADELAFWMEDGGNQNLLELLQARGGRGDDGTFRWYVGLQLADALVYLHAQQPPVIHRDLKSLNVLVDSASLEAKVCDFGISKEQYDTKGSTQTTVAGTPSWMAPEQVRHEASGWCSESVSHHFLCPVLLHSPQFGNNKLTTAADVWSFGCMLVELFTRPSTPPFQGKSMKQIVKIHTRAELKAEVGIVM
jgi:serine/threonine protein kinase